MPEGFKEGNIKYKVRSSMLYHARLSWVESLQARGPSLLLTHAGSPE